MYAIGVDSGTQGTKVLIVDLKGKVLGRGYHPHRFIENLRPGESEQDPWTWMEALEKALTGALRGGKLNPSKAISLGISGQQHGFVPLDNKGAPIRAAKLWNDTSTIEETEIIIKKFGGHKSFIKELGLSLAVGYTASKILWLKRKEPKNYSQLSMILLPHNYLNYCLTGRAHMEYGDASGTGLMDIQNRCWHQKALEATDPGLEKKLPPLSHPEEPVGYMKDEIAQRFGMGKILVSSGGGDNMMGAIGTGNVSPGVCTLSLGTSGTIYSYFPEPFIDPEGEIAAFCDSTGAWLPLLCTMNVTNTTEYFKDLFNISAQELDQLASQTASGSEGLIFLPFINGERVPVLPHSNAVFFGLNRKNFNASCMARSIMEGTIFNLGYGFSRMKALGLNPSEIRATGGGAKSRLWLQIAANMLKTPVATLEEEEAAAFGAALQSIWSYYRTKGDKINIEEMTQELVKKKSSDIEPDPKTLALYERLQERFNSLWKTLKKEFKEHRKLKLD